MCVGSGTLLTAMALAWPHASFVCVQVGAKVDWNSLHFRDRVQLVYQAPESFGEVGKIRPPYPAAAHYEAKMWQFILRHAHHNDIVWNVAGDVLP